MSAGSEELHVPRPMLARNESRESAVLIARNFPPLNVVSAQRAMRMARVLLERYKRVYVIAQDPKQLDSSKLDFEMGADLMNNPRLVVLHARTIFPGYGYSNAPSWLHRLFGAAITRIVCSTGTEWVPGLKHSLRCISAENRICVVVATGAPFITFLPVVRWASYRSAPVLLDYRDLWTSHPHAPYPAIARFLVKRLIEQRVNRCANALTTVSDGCKTILARQNPAIPVKVLYNVPDLVYLNYYHSIKEDCTMQQRRADGKLRIVYTGTVYQACTFAPLLHAIASLPQEKRQLIEVHYYGGSSSIVEAEFRQFGQPVRLFNYGHVSKKESIKAILGADLLLSLIHTERISSDASISGVMSAKIFDYFLSGNPILNISPSDAEINKFAGMIGYAPFYSVTADNTEGIRACLVSFFSNGPSMSSISVPAQLPDFSSGFHTILDQVEAK